MDTKKDSAASDVPTFKVARVGNDRKRKGAGFSFLRSGGSRGGFTGATGGSGGGLGGLLGGAGGGAGAQAGFLASKFVQAMLGIMLASGVGATAMYIGSLSAQGNEPVKKAAPFVAKDDIKLEGDTTNLPGDPNAIPNSLGYLSGSMDGLTPEERAKRAADEAARKAAEEEAARKAEEEANRTAAAPAVDPNALLASAQADGQNKGGGLGRKFGNLSSSFGGGSSLAGGAGMAGGVGRGFSSGGGGSIKGGARGSLSKGSMTAKPSYARASNARGAGSNVKGFARRQLANANALSRRGATAGKSESAAYDAGSAFDNNQGAGNVISGPGIGSGAGPNNGGADGSVNPGGGSGPTGSTPTDCGANNYQTADGTCAPIPTQQMKKDTTNDWMYKTAQAIMTAVTVLTAIWWASKSLDWLAGAGQVIANACAVAIVALAGILTALGLAMIAATGDKLAGGLISLVGAYTLYMAFYGTAATAGGLALKIMVPVMLGGFGSAMAKKPAAASQ